MASNAIYELHPLESFLSKGSTSSSLSLFSSDEVKTVANKLKTNIDDVTTISNKVPKIIEQMKSYLEVSGLNYDSVTKSFQSGFNTLINNLTTLSDSLNNRIIPLYEDMYNQVKNIFNKEFASQISSLLNIR